MERDLSACNDKNFFAEFWGKNLSKEIVKSKAQN